MTTDLSVPVFVLGFATLLLSLTVSYVNWARIRVFLVQEDLYAIRDRLWDTARSRGRFCDPAYLEARSRLNDLIAVAGLMNLPLLLLCIERGKGIAALPERTQSDDVDFDAEIRHAMEDAAVCLLRYMLYHRVSGLIRLPFAAAQRAREGFGAWLCSRWVGELATHTREHSVTAS